MDLSTISALADVQPQSKETFESHPSMQEGDETVQLPFIESGDASVQGGMVDLSINNEAASKEELTTAIDVEVTTLESPAQSSEVQGTLIHINRTLS